MFSTFTAEFTRGAILIVNSVETLAVLYAVLFIMNYLNDAKAKAAAQLEATQALVTAQQQTNTALATLATFLQNAQPGA